MTGGTCRHEEALLDALAEGRWPQACDPELRAHVDACSECRDLALVAEAFVEDRRETLSVMSVPPAGAVWWRMQARLERETQEAAIRTVSRAHGVTIAATVLLLVMAVGMTSLVQKGWALLRSLLPDVQELAGLSSSIPIVAVVPVVLLLLVLAPIAVYLAVAD